MMIKHALRLYMFRASGIWGKSCKCCVCYHDADSSSPPLKAEVITHNQSPVLISEGFASYRGWCWFTDSRTFCLQQEEVGALPAMSCPEYRVLHLRLFNSDTELLKAQTGSVDLPLLCLEDGLRCKLPLWKAAVSGGDGGCLCRALANCPQPWTWRQGERSQHMLIYYFLILSNWKAFHMTRIHCL